MTNLEKFKQYIREEVERNLKYYEAMTSEELARNIYENPEQEIRVKIGEELGYFKARATGSCYGGREKMAAWLAEEVTESRGPGSPS